MADAKFCNAVFFSVITSMPDYLWDRQLMLSKVSLMHSQSMFTKKNFTLLVILFDFVLILRSASIFAKWTSTSAYPRPLTSHRSAPLIARLVSQTWALILLEFIFLEKTSFASFHCNPRRMLCEHSFAFGETRGAEKPKAEGWTTFVLVSSSCSFLFSLKGSAFQKFHFLNFAKITSNFSNGKDQMSKIKRNSIK